MKFYKIAVIVILCYCLVFINACQKTCEIAGEYEAMTDEENEITLTFHPDGKGAWSFDDEDACFQWEVRDNEVWIHTKTGGVLPGKIKDNTIEIELPMVGHFIFKPKE